MKLTAVLLLASACLASAYPRGLSGNKNETEIKSILNEHEININNEGDRLRHRDLDSLDIVTEETESRNVPELPSWWPADPTWMPLNPTWWPVVNGPWWPVNGPWWPSTAAWMPWMPASWMPASWWPTNATWWPENGPWWHVNGPWWQVNGPWTGKNDWSKTNATWWPIISKWWSPKAASWPVNRTWMPVNNTWWVANETSSARSVAPWSFWTTNGTWWAIPADASWWPNNGNWTQLPINATWWPTNVNWTPLPANITWWGMPIPENTAWWMPATWWNNKNPDSWPSWWPVDATWWNKNTDSWPTWWPVNATWWNKNTDSWPTWSPINWNKNTDSWPTWSPINATWWNIKNVDSWPAWWPATWWGVNGAAWSINSTWTPEHGAWLSINGTWMPINGTWWSENNNISWSTAWPADLPAEWVVPTWWPVNAPWWPVNGGSWSINGTWTPESGAWLSVNGTWIPNWWPKENSWNWNNWTSNNWNNWKSWTSNNWTWKNWSSWWNKEEMNTTEMKMMPTPWFNWNSWWTGLNSTPANATWSTWTSNNTSRPRVLACLADNQNWAKDECVSVASNWYKTWAKRNFDDCVAKSSTYKPEGEEWDVKEHCRTIQTKQMRVLYTDCIISKSKSMNDATGKIDIPTLKSVVIGGSNLSVSQQTGAMETFDACMASEFNLPYSMYHYISKIMPVKTYDYTFWSDRVFRIGKLTPTKSIVTVDCMKTALLLNGCADGVSKATWDQVVEQLKTMDRNQLE